MNPMLHIFTIVFALAGTAWAEPIKCVIDGKTIYTDDASRCAGGNIRPINNNVSVFPEVDSANKPSTIPLPTGSPAEPVSDSILNRFGISPEDIAAGWKTIMDAKKRGSWKEPEIPEDAK